MLEDWEGSGRRSPALAEPARAGVRQLRGRSRGRYPSVTSTAQPVRQVGWSRPGLVALGRGLDGPPAGMEEDHV